MATGSNLIDRPTVDQVFGDDLSAIEGLTTTSFGRSLLELADAAALRTIGDLVPGTNVQTQSTALQAIDDEDPTPLPFGIELLALVSQAALLAAAGAAAAVHVHSGAAITSGTVVDARIDAAIARDAEVAAAYQPLAADLTTLLAAIPQAAIANANATSLVLIADVITVLNDIRTKFNTLLAELRTAGVIAT